MKQKPFPLHNNISPLKAWSDKYVQMVREAALADSLPKDAAGILHRLANELDEKAKSAWQEIERAAKQELLQKRFGQSNKNGGQL